MALLEIAHLSLRFGGVTALQDVSFSVEPGAISAIIGPNGAGKTSLLNCISGVYRPQKGTIRFDAADVTHLRPAARTRLGIARTFQNIALFKGMTVLDNLLIGRHCHQKTGVLGGGLYYGLGEREEIRDRGHIEQVIDILEERGTTILMIEHDMGVVMDLSHRVVVLNFGQKIADGTPEEVQQSREVQLAYLGGEAAA